MENQQHPISFDNMPGTVSKVYSEVTKIKDLLLEMKDSLEPKKPTEWLTRKEVAALLKCNLSTVHNWTIKGKLKKYSIGDRTYYKRSEVEGALVRI